MDEEISNECSRRREFEFIQSSKMTLTRNACQRGGGKSMSWRDSGSPFPRILYAHRLESHTWTDGTQQFRAMVGSCMTSAAPRRLPAGLSIIG
uniref:Uncharacterized protein n=1 Tax=Physcomitrium patens TaxID=3218 RepID=A0A2K1LAB2_PHYPA|nr:hypothetical protein PHYPA_001380 [Physcomitrium patens]